MRLDLRAKLFLMSLGLVAVSVFAADLVLTRGLVPELTERTRQDLLARTRLAAREASRAPYGLDDLAAWDALADSIGSAAGARITIIRRDGRVIGDSDIDPARLPGIENHAGRPEVIEALARGSGSGSRWSGTLHESMMYVGVAFLRTNEVAGVVRAAIPLTEVALAVRRLRGTILAASVLALLVAVVMSSLAASWVSAPVRALTAAAKRMAGGDLTVKSPASGRDEVSELARALNQLGDNLSRTLGRLREERDLEERILINMREGVLLLGEDGRIAATNPALREMLLIGTQAAGRPVIEVIRHAELHEVLEEVRRTGERESAEIELGGMKPRRVLVHASPLGGVKPGRETGGEPGETGGTGLLVVFVDVTELRRLETVRKDFVANVSHELRTPIASIAGAAETVGSAMTRDPEAARSFLEIIERNAARMREMVDDLLDLSRIESREFQLEIRPVEVGPCVDRVLASFEPRAKQKRIGLRGEIHAPFPRVTADERALEQILSNLVDNAIKYSEEGAAVVLSAEEAGGTIRLVVKDTGPGIEERHLPRLFERFYRVDPGRSREVGGTGLGLSIVRNLVEAMSGSVAVESTPGRGSSFVVTLPRA